ncbi:MAG: nucleotidyltransferase domain-containing protein [Candidatus Thiothrix moscowensis]|nr:nucleotidyltransferase domain-containing protein [Candidatus Thiothrix moscowensis]
MIDYDKFTRALQHRRKSPSLLAADACFRTGCNCPAYHPDRAKLQQYLPNTQIWAFGSRTKGTSRPTSDLDLVAFVPNTQTSQVYAAREALEESSLPFRVDLLEWDELATSFQQNILQHYIPLG